MQDITFRAIDVLQSVDVVLCEDTRVSKRLLDFYDIDTPAKAVHQHTKDDALDDIVAELVEGKSFALISDAGTPLLSDPGHALVTKARAADITVTPIPGASALLAALQASGVDTRSFTYLGFIPHKKGRQTMLQEALASERTVVMYESPHRILKTLSTLNDMEIQGEYSKHITVARELTKKFEEFVTGAPAEVLASFENRPSIKGEFVVIVHEPLKA